MKNTKIKYSYALLLFGAMALAYLGYWLTPLMLYREGFALFLFDSSFASNMLAVPSGAIDYVTQFIAQFFLYPWLGATLIAGLLTYIAWATSRWSGGKSALCFIVPIWLVGLMGDMNFDMRALSSVVILALGAQSTRWVKREWWSAVIVLLISLVSAPLGVVLTLMFVAGRVWGAEPKTRTIAYLATLLAALAVGAAAARWLLFTDSNFSAIFATKNILHTPMAVVLILTPLAVRLTTKWLDKLTIANLALIVGGTCAAVFSSPLESSIRSLLAIDGKIRKNNYREVVRIASQQKGEPLRQNGFYVALAQAELGTMGSEFFQFAQQWGSTVLYHEFRKEPLELFMCSELYSRLGHWNYAYRYAMEGVVLNTRPSARMLKMMARAAAANGDRPLVEKYTRTLHRTLFYRNATQDIYSNLPAINKQMPTTNMSIGDGHNSYLFLSKAHQACPDNRMVYEYLMTDLMLKGRLELMVSYLPAAQKFYTTLPSLLQQAILVYWAQTNKGLELVERYVTDPVSQVYIDFTKIMNQAANRTFALREKMLEPYRDTYFYYITSDAPKK